MKITQDYTILCPETESDFYYVNLLAGKVNTINVHDLILLFQTIYPAYKELMQLE